MQRSQEERKRKKRGQFRDRFQEWHSLPERVLRLPEVCLSLVRFSHWCVVKLWTSVLTPLSFRVLTGTARRESSLPLRGWRGVLTGKVVKGSVTLQITAGRRHFESKWTEGERGITGFVFVFPWEKINMSVSRTILALKSVYPLGGKKKVHAETTIRFKKAPSLGLSRDVKAGVRWIIELFSPLFLTQSFRNIKWVLNREVPPESHF